MIKELLIRLMGDRSKESEARLALDFVNMKIDAHLHQSSYGVSLVKERNAAILEKDEMKSAAKETEDVLRSTAVELAQNRKDKGEKWDGGWLDPNIKVIKKTELMITDLPVAVAFLVACGKEEIVTIKLHGNTGFFKNAALPPAINLVNVPGIRINKEIIM